MIGIYRNNYDLKTLFGILLNQSCQTLTCMKITQVFFLFLPTPRGSEEFCHLTHPISPTWHVLSYDDQ